VDKSVKSLCNPLTFNAPLFFRFSIHLMKARDREKPRARNHVRSDRALHPLRLDRGEGRGEVSTLSRFGPAAKSATHPTRPLRPPEPFILAIYWILVFGSCELGTCAPFFRFSIHLMKAQDRKKPRACNHIRSDRTLHPLRLDRGEGRGEVSTAGPAAKSATHPPRSPIHPNLSYWLLDFGLWIL